jgi:hypothetical protein
MTNNKIENTLEERKIKALETIATSLWTISTIQIVVILFSVVSFIYYAKNLVG